MAGGDRSRWVSGTRFCIQASSSSTDRGWGGFLPSISQRDRTGLSPPGKIGRNSRHRSKNDSVVWNRQKTLRTGQSEGQMFLGSESDQTHTKEPRHMRRQHLTHPGDRGFRWRWRFGQRWRFAARPSTCRPQEGAGRGWPFVSGRPTSDFFRQITSKESSDNWEKKNV